MNEERMFPSLTESRQVPAHLLYILKHADTAGFNQAISSHLTKLDDQTLLTLPETVEQALGPHHPETAKFIHRLAVLYHSRDDLERAERLYRRALKAAERAFTKSDPETGLIMNNLGRVLHARGNLTEAGELYQQALCFLEQTLGAEHPKLATPLSNAASLYRDQGLYDRAQKLYENALAILQEALGPQHPKVLKAMRKLQAVQQLCGAAATV
jgi:tetratricopeptide (TPR) repeat protein